MIKQANAHLGIVCRDIEKSIRFYEDVLGMRKKFTLYYGDMMPGDPEWLARVTPERLAFLKERENLVWLVCMEWPDAAGGYFLELFNEVGAHILNPPGKDKFGFSHMDIVVDDILAFQEMIIEKGAEDYIDIPPSPAISRSYTMWLRDPDANPIEVHEYTPVSMQLIGRELPEGVTWQPGLPVKKNGNI